MSITLGDYNWTSKKTVGDTSGAFYNDITSTPPCEETISLATVQPKWKKIHEFTRSIVAQPNLLSGLWEIVPTFNSLPDDVFADGFDYEVEILLNYVGASPSLNIIRQRFSYTQLGNNWFQNVVSSDKIIMNENNCGGSYANTLRTLVISANDIVPFTLEVVFNIKQLIPATIEIEVCYGGTLTHLTELEEITETITVYIGDGEEPSLGESVISTKRNSNYDPYDLGPEEYSKMPQSCSGYSVYYVSNIFSSGYSAPFEKTYWLDEGIYKAKINIPKVPPQVLDFKLWDGSIYVFNEPSDVNGLIDWIDFVPALSPGGVNTSLELWNGGVQEGTSNEQYVYFRYDLESYNCPCVCVASCDGELDIQFNLNCGTSQTIRLRSSVQDGVYSVEGEAYNALYPIKPIVRTKATYDLVITDYTDEVYLILMDLISDTDTINIYDNIGIPGYTNYVIDIDSLQPAWRFDSKVANIKIPIIRTDSIKTKRRNCCD